MNNLVNYGILGAVVIAGTVFMMPFTIVPSGNIGVMNTFGKVESNALSEGLHFRAPWQGVTMMDKRLRAFHTEATASSSDLQNVTTQFTIQYSLASQYPQVFQRMGDLERIEASTLLPAIQESLKSVTAMYTAEELITKRQLVKSQVEAQIYKFLNTTLHDKGLDNAITISNVAITDFKFSDDFNKAIEAKVTAEQQALQAKNTKNQKITEAEADAAQRRLDAEAKAYSVKQEADANAYSIEKNSIMRAQAIQRESAALKSNPDLVKLRIAEQWNGQMPQVTSGMPLIQFPMSETKSPQIKE